MIVFFGPAGAGKSVQANLLAARNDWRWLGAGQLLRDSKDPELLARMSTGKLVEPEIVNRVMGEALNRANDKVRKVILDGYPRQLAQAKCRSCGCFGSSTKRIDAPPRNSRPFG